ncbi:MAG: hypothetical protein P8M68_05750 [Aquiluna sp.]|nr:hypothetical protein [Aquiluna sp.]
MPTEFSRFETSRRGYDPKAVDKEINALNSELVRLREQVQESAEALREATSERETLTSQLAASKAPNFASLGSEAADLLVRAETTARELEEAASTRADEIIELATNESEATRLSAEALYQEQSAAAERRAARTIASAKHEAELLIAKSKAEARDKIRDTELEVARLRGQAATEVAAMKTTARREVEAKKAELDGKIAAQSLMSLEELGIENAAKEHALAALESKLKTRRRAGEKEYLEKHNEAVRQTEEYLALAKKDLTELKKTISTVRLEIQALEMDAGQAQTRILSEARATAEALTHQSELEANEIKRSAEKQAAETAKLALLRAKEYENRVRSSEIYLKNLRTLVNKHEPMED